MSKLIDIIATLPPDQLAKAVPHLEKLETLSQRQHQGDAETVRSIIRVLKHPAHQRLASELRDLILRGATH